MTVSVYNQLTIYNIKIELSDTIVQMDSTFSFVSFTTKNFILIVFYINLTQITLII